MKSIVAAAAACLLFTALPVRAQITGAGSGSTGGTITGKTNETQGQVQTGAANGSETVTNKQDKAGTGTGDNAILNAPGEPVPNTKPGSLPSNLNGKYQ